MKKVAIYTRVSTDKEEQQLSFKTQKEYYIKYCSDNDYILHRIYADEGLTGTNFNRKDFLEMLYDSGVDVIRNKENRITGFEKSNREPKFNLIIMKDISRFSRNVNSIEVARYLRDKGVYILFENSNITTLNDNWEFEFSLFLTFSQQESIDRSNKLKWAYERKTERGEWFMTRPLLGYERNESGEFVINENEAEIVRLTFHLYTEKLIGTKELALTLNDMGYRSKTGKLFNASTVKRILTNEKYFGKVILNKYTKPPVTNQIRTRRLRAEDEQKYISDGIPAIIDQETFDKAAKILHKRVKEMSDGSKVGIRKVKAIFYNKLVCSKCGSYFVRVSGTKKRNGEKVTEYTYYCKNRRTYGTKICNCRGVSENVLLREIERIINQGTIRHMALKIEKDGDLETSLYQRIKKKLNDKKASLQDNIDSINEEIEVVNNHINKLFDNFLNADMSDNVKQLTQQKLDDLSQRKNDLEKEKLDNSLAHIESQEELLEEQYKRVLSWTKKKNYTVKEVLELVKRIEIHEWKELHFYFSLPSILNFDIELDAQDKTPVLVKWVVKY
ncbi:recombinase family protein [Priestia flexa]|uniref:recombinase family protein n=1 Tax=Priestia flexa TaxID=86664 RepID=UPI00240E47E8|nr:recombinase family protein [Priestia flexa]WEZ09601.1 recombinase family protein [Priestia flexa]